MPNTFTKKFRLSSGLGVRSSRWPKWAISMIGSGCIAKLRLPQLSQGQELRHLPREESLRIRSLRDKHRFAGSRSQPCVSKHRYWLMFGESPRILIELSRAVTDRELPIVGLFCGGQTVRWGEGGSNLKNAEGKLEYTGWKPGVTKWQLNRISEHAPPIARQSWRRSRHGGERSSRAHAQHHGSFEMVGRSAAHDLHMG